MGDRPFSPTQRINVSARLFKGVYHIFLHSKPLWPAHPLLQGTKAPRAAVEIAQRFPGPVVFHWRTLDEEDAIIVPLVLTYVAWFEGAGGQWIAFEKATGAVLTNIVAEPRLELAVPGSRILPNHSRPRAYVPHNTIPARSYSAQLPPFEWFTQRGVGPLDEDSDVVWELKAGQYRASRLSTLQYDDSVKPRLMTERTSLWVLANAKNHLGEMKRLHTGDRTAEWDTRAVPMQQTVEKKLKKEHAQAGPAFFEQERGVADRSPPDTEPTTTVGLFAKSEPGLDNKNIQPPTTYHHRAKGASPAHELRKVLAVVIATTNQEIKLERPKIPENSRKRTAMDSDEESSQPVTIKRQKTEGSPKLRTAYVNPRVIMKTGSKTQGQPRPRRKTTTIHDYTEQVGSPSSQRSMTELLESDVIIPSRALPTNWWNLTTMPPCCRTLSGDLLLQHSTNPRGN